MVCSLERLRLRCNRMCLELSALPSEVSSQAEPLDVTTLRNSPPGRLER